MRAQLFSKHLFVLNFRFPRHTINTRYRIFHDTDGCPTRDQPNLPHLRCAYTKPNTSITFTHTRESGVARIAYWRNTRIAAIFRTRVATPVPKKKKDGFNARLIIHLIHGRSDLILLPPHPCLSQFSRLSPASPSLLCLAREPS